MIEKKIKKLKNDRGKIVEREVYIKQDKNGNDVEVNELGFSFNEVMTNIRVEYYKALKRMQEPAKSIEECIELHK